MNKLKEYLSTTVMNHINDVRGAFELCTNEDDINDVIKMIPVMYGSFSAEINGSSFRICNSYEDCYEEEDFDFYIKEELEK